MSVSVTSRSSAKTKRFISGHRLRPRDALWITNNIFACENHSIFSVVISAHCVSVILLRYTNILIYLLTPGRLFRRFQFAAH